MSLEFKSESSDRDGVRVWGRRELDLVFVKENRVRTFCVGTAHSDGWRGRWEQVQVEGPGEQSSGALEHGASGSLAAS